VKTTPALSSESRDGHVTASARWTGLTDQRLTMNDADDALSTSNELMKAKRIPEVTSSAAMTD